MFTLHYKLNHISLYNGHDINDVKHVSAKLSVDLGKVAETLLCNYSCYISTPKSSKTTDKKIY